MNNNKVAAIWCWVSIHDQRELSQHVLKVDWTSLDLMGCPEFQQLRRWIAEGAVRAVGVLDRDRLQAQGLQRLVFLSECQERGVRVITVQGVPTRKGSPVWMPTTVLGMLHNRVYAGVVEALRTEAVVPKRRRGNSYGKSAVRLRPQSQRIRLEGLVAQPIVTKEEFEWVQVQLLKNSRLARRNGKLRVYLLRGMFQCSTCGRSYVGVTRQGRSYYYCRGTWGLPAGVEKCSTKTRFFADVIEEQVYGAVAEFLRSPEAFLAEAESRRSLQGETVESIRQDLAGLEWEDARAMEDEAMAFARSPGSAVANSTAWRISRMRQG